MRSPFKHNNNDMAGGIRIYAGIIALLWTVLNVILLILDFREGQAWVRRIALNEARAYFNKDQAFRLWATSHGGVYVPVDRDTPPNPLLSHIPDRDIQRGDGRVLTLMNPAYMVRQMNEKYSTLYGVAGRITSLKPLRPQNAPDRWERDALTAFEKKNIKETVDFTAVQGKPYLRIMRPMITDRQCLKCHAMQGYKEGSIRGGVSITMPLSGHYQSHRSAMLINASARILIWVLGLGGIALWSKQIRRNIGRRKLVRESLIASEKKFRAIFENSIEGIYQTTMDGRFITVNPSLARMFGYESTGEMINCINDIGWQIYVNPEDRTRLKEILENKGRADDFEAEVYRNDGSRFWITMNSRAVRDTDDARLYIEGSAVNITERKMAELALKESEERYRELYTSTPVMLHSIDRDGRLISVSDHWLNAMGYTRDEVIGHLSTEFLTEESRTYAKEAILPEFYRTGTCMDVPYQLVSKTGRIIDVSLSAIGEKDPRGKVVRSLAVLLDVTERKKAEAELRESEERYRHITHSVTDYIYTVQIENGLAVRTVHGAASKAVTGYTEEEFNDDPLLWIRLVPEDDREKVRHLAERILSGAPSTELEHRIIRKDGSVRWVRTTQVPHCDDSGRLVSYDGLISDITERKRAEEALLENEKRFRTIIESTGAGYFRIGTDGLFHFVNTAWLRMHGYSSPDEVIGKHLAITQVDMDMSLAQGMVDGLLHGRLARQGESSRRNRDGGIGYQSLTINPVLQAGKVMGLEGFLIDITPYKKTVDALEKSEERFRALFDTMTEGVAIHKLVYNYKGKPVDYIIMDSNPAFTTHTGIDREKVVGKKTTDAYGTDIPPYFEVYTQVAITGEPARFESYFEPLKKHFSISAFSPAHGFFATVFEDITERIQTADSLRAAKEYAENLIQTANAMIIGLDLEGTVTIFNEAAEKITGYSRADLVGRDWFEVLAPGERHPDVWAEFNKTLSSETQKNFENPILTKSGEERIIAWQNSVLTEKGRVTGTISFGIDITERKIAEERITASLREKELLLKEIHHRVKNNMQIIMSLLRMKAEKVRDPEIAQLFQDSQNRIFSMALIHERMYQTQDFTQIDLNDYTRSLIEELFCLYDVGLSRIRYRLDIHDIYMGIDQAIPFGLVINELVTNSIKYAFPADSAGERLILISMSAVNGSIETIVSDNGIGILESVDYRNTESSGLTLVHMIIEKQLQGNIRLSREKGTSFSISIPRDYRTALNN